MRGKIFVVTPKSTVRSMVESLLKEQGWEVVCFDQAQKVLDLLSFSNPDLIIADQALSQPGAEAICQRVHHEEKLKGIPVIILLTLEEMKDSESLREAGASNFVVKPFSPVDLLEKVEIYLLEKAASTGEGLPAVPKSPQDAANPPLDSIFSTEGALDIDSILSEGRTANQRAHLEEMLKPAEEEKLEIQTGSVWMDFAPEPEQKSGQETQHDYGWFLDEMQGQAAGKKVVPQSETAPYQPLAEQTQNTSPPKGKEKFRAEELGTSKLDVQKPAPQIISMEINKPEPAPAESEFSPQVVLDDEELAKSKQPAPSKPETTKLMPSSGGTEYQKLYADLTEKIAARLAKELVDRLKPETIMQLLKEELEKTKS